VIRAHRHQLKLIKPAIAGADVGGDGQIQIAFLGAAGVVRGQVAKGNGIRGVQTGLVGIVQTG